MDVTVSYRKEATDRARVSVSESGNGEVCLRISTDGGEDRLCFMSQTHSVVLWKCLTRALNECMFHCRDKADASAPEIRQIRVSYDSKVCVWEVRYQDMLFCLDIDEATALSWALQKCVADSFAEAKGSPKGKEPPRHVYVLSSRIVLTGGAAVDGCEHIGGSEEVYSSEEKARDALREFMRPLVNEANSETHWGITEEDVDDILDDIIRDEVIDDGLPGRCFRYDGDKQSFEARITKVEVK